MRTFIAIIVAAAGLAGAGTASAEGLPQLNPAHYPPQLVWLAISFALLYLAMSRLALPRVRQVLEDRRRRIDDNLRKAETFKADAEAAAEAYEKAMTEARANAQEVLRVARAKAAADAAARHAALGKRLETEVSAAEARIAEAKHEAIAGIRDVAVDVSTSVVAKLMGEAADQSAIAKAVERTLKERG